MKKKNSVIIKPTLIEPIVMKRDNDSVVETAKILIPVELEIDTKLESQKIAIEFSIEFLKQLGIQLVITKGDYDILANRKSTKII